MRAQQAKMEKRSPLDRVHEAIETADWQRSGLDRVARWSLRPRVPASLSNVTPGSPVPTARHSASVIIPCFNYARFLPGAVASALDQGGVDIEVIVVDDASTDDSLEVARSLAAADSRIVVVAQPENRGHVRSFNEGLQRARGDLIVRLDADDLLTPGSLTRASALFQQHPEVGLVYGHPRHFVEDDVPEPRLGNVTWTIWHGRDWISRRCARGTNCITTPEAVIRASVFEQVGGLNPRLRFAQDMEIWLRVAAVSDVARINDVDQALHRDHASSMSVNEGAGLLTDLVERRTVFCELFAAMEGRVSNTPELLSLARRTLAREALRHANYMMDRGRFDSSLAAQLTRYACETDPAVTSTLAWHTHELRSRLGPYMVRRDPMALVRVARVRACDELAYLQWARTGL